MTGIPEKLFLKSPKRVQDKAKIGEKAEFTPK
jgi:hypothetical protein